MIFLFLKPSLALLEAELQHFKERSIFTRICCMIYLRVHLLLSMEVWKWNGFLIAWRRSIFKPWDKDSFTQFVVEMSEIIAIHLYTISHSDEKCVVDKINIPGENNI